ncbi:glycosyl hydrolase family 18 protein [Ramlibacter rhizophilus]|uniref:GH18 domain-containing protein n=1 Tax=Ramlibacter rhizophilus TaxID=1781167 RepID=A0A4Z0BKN4_9BURK|nr:glycosyl hydrolase family 18 protein [Ramlibacter rhizophilus]TFY98654.1 hypothetical protein EZ242_14095 [Ramlibacter rhizophilus]
MNRRLFLHTGSAAAVFTLTACGGGGGGALGVETVGSAVPVTPVDSGPQPVTPSAAAVESVAAKGLPDKILGCYYTTWDTGRFKITDVPVEFNVIYLFHAKPESRGSDGSYNNGGNGAFFFEHYDAVKPEQIQACRARGQRVILTAGGAQAGYAWDNRTKSTNFVESIKVMYARLGGFDGLDFNNFEAHILSAGNVAAVSTEMVWIASQLKALYGSEFAITAPPQPNSPEQQRLMADMAKAGVLDYAGPQFYDWSGFNAPGYIKGRVDTWVGLLGDKRTVVGLSANYSNGPSMADCLREWDAAKAAHPGLRGMFCWSAQTQLAGGNAWAKEMAKRL